MNGRGELMVRTDRGVRRVLVEIRDNGPGIPTEIRDRIFDPFFTTKPVGEGTGLGLDTVYRIVKTHRGQVQVESQCGTDFVSGAPAVRRAPISASLETSHSCLMLKKAFRKRCSHPLSRRRRARGRAHRKAPRTWCHPVTPRNCNRSVTLWAGKDRCGISQMAATPPAIDAQAILFYVIFAWPHIRNDDACEIPGLASKHFPASTGVHTPQTGCVRQLLCDPPGGETLVVGFS